VTLVELKDIQLPDSMKRALPPSSDTSRLPSAPSGAADAAP
jgi:hypothetical protein